MNRPKGMTIKDEDLKAGEEVRRASLVRAITATPLPPFSMISPLIFLSSLAKPSSHCLKLLR
jgi:hypothetical protein